MLGLTTIAVDEMSSVWPSGAAFATESVPITPLAAGRFSTTTDCPSCV